MVEILFVIQLVRDPVQWNRTASGSLGHVHPRLEILK